MLPLFSNARVLVAGDVMLDRYWFGTTKRISPEAPVPVVNIGPEETRPGGAGNVALNLAKLGVKTQLIAMTGEDEAALCLKTDLEQAGVIASLQTSAAHPTITKLRVLSQQQQLIRLDFESPFSDKDLQSLIPTITEALNNTDVLLLSDYGKGIVTIIPELIKAAKERNIPVLVDPKSDDFSIYQGATLITPNRMEFEKANGITTSRENMIARAQTAITQLNLEAFLITLGEEGMLLVQKNGDSHHLSAESKEVFDVTGAGDTVISMMAAALATGESLKSAMKLANAAASVVVSKLGAATVSTNELLDALHQNKPPKIHSLEVLKDKCLDWKASGNTIAFTNGCFDILHAGHIKTFDEAKKMGDKLIVAVNSDLSVQKLKGNKRPIVALDDRLALLASIQAIDAIIAFDDDTPIELINCLTPDVLVKGGDYTTDTIVGAGWVEKNGGKVITVPLKEGISTSLIIEKIIANA